MRDEFCNCTRGRWMVGMLHTRRALLLLYAHWFVRYPSLYPCFTPQITSIAGGWSVIRAPPGTGTTHQTTKDLAMPPFQRAVSLLRVALVPNTSGSLCLGVRRASICFRHAVKACPHRHWWCGGEGGQPSGVIRCWSTLQAN